MRKYEFTEETKVVMGRTLHRIKALVSFGHVDAGELGGWIESEGNLSQSGDAWVYGDAWVSGDAHVSGDARVSGNAHVSGDAWVYGDVHVSGNAQVYGIGAICWISGIGSRNETTTFFACKDKKIRVVCGCFFGALDEFEKAVETTHGDNAHAKA